MPWHIFSMMNFTRTAMPSRDQITNKAFITRSIIDNGIDYKGVPSLGSVDIFENLYVKWSPEVKEICHNKIKEECLKVRKGLEDIDFKWEFDTEPFKK